MLNAMWSAVTRMYTRSQGTVMSVPSASRSSFSASTSARSRRVRSANWPTCRSFSEGAPGSAGSAAAVSVRRNILKKPRRSTSAIGRTSPRRCAASVPTENPMADGPDINHQIIDEFRANGGRVRGPAEGFSLLLLHTRGARSGAARVNPVAYQPLADGWAVFATHAGAPRHPAWYHNVLANPETIVEIGTETVPVRARVAVGEERERIW